MMKRRGELKIIEQALRNNWAISQKGATEAMALVRQVLADSSATERERLRAAKILLLMEAANMEFEIDQALLDQVRAIGSFLNTRIKND